jgi:hypothetical protein
LGRSWNLDDELDALLDASRNGTRVARRAELAPLVEVAAALRAELSAIQIDPAVAHQHLTSAIGAPRFAPTAPSPNGNGFGTRIGTEIPPEPVPPAVERPAHSRFRRRVTMIALAASLALIPATMASGTSLPGQPLYPVKRSIEQVRLAALAWSPAGTAREQLRIADVRSAELAGLVRRGAVGQIPGAIVALQAAVDAAGQAVDQASMQEGSDSARAVALRQDLAEVTNDQILQLTSVAERIPTTSPAATQAIEAANEALVSAKRRQQQQQGGMVGHGAPASTTAWTPTSATGGAVLPGLATAITTTTLAVQAAASTSSTIITAGTAASGCGDRPKSRKKRRQWAECMLASGQPVDQDDLVELGKDAYPATTAAG